MPTDAFMGSRGCHNRGGFGPEGRGTSAGLVSKAAVRGLCKACPTTEQQSGLVLATSVAFDLFTAHPLCFLAS